jgi:hypothetical protein
MKYLLNEHLNVLRIANIQNKEREYEEFLQSLYEINLINNYSKDQLLNEGFVDKVKDTFKKATDQSKKYLQYSFNQFKKNGEKPSEFVKDIGDVFQGVNIKNVSDLKNLKDVLKLAKIYSLSDKNINEANGKSVNISSINDLEKLQNGQKFIWKGKYEPDYEDAIGKILNPIRGKVGQTSGDIYGLVPDEEYYWAYDDANNQKYLVNNRQKNTIEKSSDYAGGGVIQKIGDFFRKHKWLTAAMVAPVMGSAVVGGNADATGQVVKALTGGDVNINNNDVLQSGSNPDFMGDEDGDGLTKAGGGDDVKVTKGNINLGVDSPDSTDSTNIQQFKQDAKKLLPDENFDFVKAGLKFDTGEYKADQSTKDAVSKNLTKSTLKEVEKIIKEKGVTKSLTIDQKVTGHVSFNPDKSDGSNQSNVANDGSDLAKGRAATMEEITKSSNEQVAKIIKDKLGIDVKFNTETTSDSDLDGQIQHNAVDQSADQSSTTEVKVDTDGGEKIPTIKNWKPVVAVTGKGGSDMGQRVDIKRPDVKGSEDKGSEDEGPKRDERPIPTGDADPDEAKKLFKNKNLNRNQEIFSVLKMANPNIKGDPNDTTYKSWYPTIKKVVISLRKSPDTLLKKFQQVTGINLSQRQKSTGKFKRSGVAENISLGNMLNEAAIDQTLASIGVTDDAIRKNKVEVMAMLMAMYNLRYDDVDKSKLTPEEQKQLKDITVSEELEKQIQKQRPDVSVLEKDIESNSSLKTALSRISTYDEFEALVLGMAALVNPNFAKQKQDIRTALSSLASKVRAMKEESDTPSDTAGVYKIIETLKLLKNHLNNISNREEFEQLIFALLKYIDPKGTITKDTSKLANAIIAASNRSSLKDARPIDLDQLGR